MATTKLPALPKEEIRATRTSVFMKLTMAVTGTFFVAYVLLHMYGNLKAFWGASAYNDYAEHLRTMLTPILPYSGFLWIMRVLLLLSVVLHVWAAFTLWSRARSARPQRYAVKKAVAATLSARFMRWGAVCLLLFVIWHLLQFTVVPININGDHADPYGRLVAAFQVWWCVVIYLLAMIALGMHIRHGAWSAAQTMGLTGTRSRRVQANAVAITLALIISVGFSVVPLGIAFGLIK